jgi:DNA-binding transcriptional ArsR family regulator
VARQKQLPKHQSGRDMSPALIYALNHSLRRQVLRLLAEHGAERTPGALAVSASASLSDVSHHVRVLADLDVIRQTRTQMTRGARKHFYASKVSDNKLVSAILASTEEDDRPGK